jgi:hypothetical protein
VQLLGLLTYFSRPQHRIPLGRAEESQSALNELIANYREVMPYLVAKAHAWPAKLAVQSM